MAQIIDFASFKLRRTAGATAASEYVLPWTSGSWPLCRVRYFVRTLPSRRPPRCCCGRVYNEATLRRRGPVLVAIVRQELRRLEHPGDAAIPRLITAGLARPELTSVERAALSTGPCAACPVVTEQTQQLRFLWGLYRAYWRRAAGIPPPRNHQGQLAVEQSRQSAIDLRGHIRHEISLIRHLREQLALCPWARRYQVPQAGGSLLGC